jgi:hypothetical protein
MHGTKIALYGAVRGKFIEPSAPSSELCVLTGTRSPWPKSDKTVRGKTGPGNRSRFHYT